MLWVDLRLPRCGVPAQVRKAVWNLYSRPHGSFDSAFGCWDDFASLPPVWLQASLPTSSAPICVGGHPVC